MSVTILVQVLAQGNSSSIDSGILPPCAFVASSRWIGGFHCLRLHLPLLGTLGYCALSDIETFEFILHCSEVEPAFNCMDYQTIQDFSNLLHTYSISSPHGDLAATHSLLENMVGPLPDTLAPATEDKDCGTLHQECSDSVDSRCNALEKRICDFSLSFRRIHNPDAVSIRENQRTLP